METQNYSGPSTTATSAIEGRLKDGVMRKKKRKKLKLLIKKCK